MTADDFEVKLDGHVRPVRTVAYEETASPVAVDAAGKRRTGRKAIEAPAGGGNYRVSLSLPVAPGSYRLRVGVADAAGHVGSLDAPVTAQLGHVGPFLTRMS